MKEVTFAEVRDFNLRQILDCGQCFRWQPVHDNHAEDDGSGRARCGEQDESERNTCDETWRGVVGSRLAEVRYDGKKGYLEIRDSLFELGRCTVEEAEHFWRNYFDLDRDYGEIKNYLVGGGNGPGGKRPRDEIMAEAVRVGSGIRILNQDRWETLLSFIISQNNNIPRIKKCIESVAETLGEKIELPDSWETDRLYYALPLPEVLAKAAAEDMAACRLGYRDKYLIETAKQITEGGYCAETGECRLLDSISCGRASNSDAIESLRCFCGVGPKVANCVSLFCLGQVDSFPLDVWMKRVMNRLYGIPENDLKAMKEYAEEHFTPYGGIAQQYLFHYITHK